MLWLCVAFITARGGVGVVGTTGVGDGLGDAGAAGVAGAGATGAGVGVGVGVEAAARGSRAAALIADPGTAVKVPAITATPPKNTVKTRENERMEPTPWYSCGEQTSTGSSNFEGTSPIGAGLELRVREPRAGSRPLLLRTP
ncbi:MAG: hypothetical protein ABI067_15540 [Leifsonia sp.]